MSNNIHPTAIIYPNVELGKNITIGANCVIGCPPEHRDFHSEDNKGVCIDDDTVICDSVTIGAGFVHATTISTGCFILSGSYIGHDSMISRNVTISPRAVIGGHCEISEGSVIGINASLHQYSKINKNTIIGGGAFFKGTALANSKYVGVPAKRLGANVSKRKEYVIPMD